MIEFSMWVIARDPAPQARKTVAQCGTWIIHVIYLKKIPDALKE
jgi:hypothetical protein